jgi:hypothetical protein
MYYSNYEMPLNSQGRDYDKIIIIKNLHIKFIYRKIENVHCTYCVMELF